MMRSFLPTLILTAALAACQAAPPAAPPAPAPATTASKPHRVPTLVQGVCGDCHGVEPPFLSPNPEAPGFDAIANSTGLTGESLTRWLVDAHNYPEQMDFELGEDEAREVAQYMVTLQGKTYRPPQ